MPFDPSKPAPGDDLDAVLIRNQLNALKALIDAQAAQISSLQGQITAAVASSSNNSNGVGSLLATTRRSNSRCSPSRTSWMS